MRVLIADDEPVARRRLLRLMRDDLAIEIVGECSGGRTAVDQIRATAPDLVFLDIQMPDLDGFGVIAEVGADAMPPVVFVTAYDEFALRAFEVHAVDYLLKPFDAERFRDVLERAKARTTTTVPHNLPGDERLRVLLREIIQERQQARENGALAFPERMALKVDGSLRVVPVADVDWFETDGNYLRVHSGKRSYLIRNTATRLQETLDPRRFARIHRRFIINLERVVEVQPWFGGDAIVVLRDGTKLRLARSYREQFHARMLSDNNSGDPLR